MNVSKRFTASLVTIVFTTMVFSSGIAQAQTTSGYIPNADIKTDPLANRSGLSEGSGVLAKDQFAVDLFSGSANYTYPISIPKGRKEMTPSLALSYGSAARNNANLLGYGWSLSQASITRSDRLGVNHLYDNTNEFQLDLFGEGGELIPLQLTDNRHGTYAKRIEGSFNRYEYTTNEQWIVTAQNGWKYYFGKSEASRQFDSQDASRVYRWMLDEIRDLNGNYIRFEYTKDQNEMYPSAIYYTGFGTASSANDGIFTLSFIYEDRADDAISYRSGFRVVTQKRLKQIRITRKSDVSERTWNFEYQTGENKTRSLLAKIRESAKNAAGEAQSLPETLFSYTTSETTWKAYQTQDALELEFISSGGADNGNELIDVNGDGYVDLVGTLVPDDATAAANGVGDNCDTAGKTCYKKEDPTTYLNTVKNAWQEDATWDSGIHFKENQITFVDINGDLLPDIYRPPYYKDGNTSHESMAINTAKGWSDTYKEMDEVEMVDDGTRFIDINGDGLEDKIRKNGYDYQGSTGSSTMAFNDGKLNWKSVSQGWTLPATTAFSPSQTSSANAYPLDSGLRFVDANGDGLMDVALALRYDVNQDGNLNSYDQTIQELYLNNGKDGWVLESGWKFPFYFADVYYQNGWNSSSYGGECLYDVTGDGLIDWRGSNAGSHMNTGVNGWQPADWPQTLAECGGASNANSFTAYRTTDVNGDGVMDEIDTSESGIDILELSQNAKSPDVLKTISTPLGGKISVTYQMTTQYKDANGKLLNPSLPFAMATVLKVQQDDGVGTTSNQTYTYSDGRYFRYDSFRSEFGGFAKVEEQWDDRRKVYYFDQGCEGVDPCKNALYATGTLLKAGSNDTVWVVDGNKRRGFNSSSAFTDSGFSWYDVQLVDQAIIDALPEGEVWDSASDTYQYPVNLSHYVKRGKVIRSEMWDANGKKVQQENSTWLVHDLGGQRYFPYLEKKVEFSFEGGNESRERASRYRYDTGTGRPVQIEALGEVNADPATGGLLDEMDADDRSTSTTYTIDENQWLVTPDLERNYDEQNKLISAQDYTYNAEGNLDDVSQWLNTADQWIKTDYYIDGYGLTEAKVNPRDSWTLLTFEPNRHYPASITNELSHFSRSEYDFWSGQMIKEIDENDLHWLWKYDMWGRILEQYVPDPITRTPILLKKTTYYDDVFPRYSKTITTVGGVSSESRVYSDGFGRTIQEWAPAEEGFSMSDSWYNASGNVAKKSLPYFSANTDFTGRKADTFDVEYTYDSLDRVKSETAPAGKTSYTYEVWNTTLTDPNNHSKTYAYDAFNRLIEVKEFNEGQTYKTFYTYNALDQLSKITDAKGNIRQFGYDSLSRKLSQEDLHAPSENQFGTWSYTYDPNGNLLTQKDPKGDITSWTYDELDRVKNEDRYNDQSIEIIYSYDTAVNGTGLLARLKNEVSETNYIYDSLGNVSQETKTIDNKSYTIQMTYDPLGRVKQATYPGGAMVTSSVYNKGGLLETLQKDQALNVIGDLDYSSAGQIAAISYGNGTLTTNTYDPAKNNRLTQRTTSSPYNNYDEDGDGYNSKIMGGSDCNDLNASINPSIDDEAAWEGVDSNCDGLDYRAGLVKRIKDAQGKWYEVFTYEAVKMMNSGSAKAESFKGGMPWTNITATDAHKACMNMGGVLMSVDAWKASCGGASGQPFPYGSTYSSGACNDSSGSGSVQATGSYPACVSPDGGYDFLGNVGEVMVDASGKEVWMGGSINTDTANTTCQDIWYTEDDFGGSMPARETIGFRCMKPIVEKKGSDVSELIDSDEDGLPNDDEASRYYTDPLNSDTDFDHLGDGDEILDHLTDPLNPDTDSDLLLDGDEVKNYGTDPQNVDSDGNNLPDPITTFEIELNPYNSNPLQFTPVTGAGTTTLSLIDPNLNGILLEGVEYRLETGEEQAWNTANAVDASWDEFTEEYTFQLENLAPGDYTLAVRGKALLGSDAFWTEPAVATFKVLADADQDGLEDSMDNCPENANPEQEDSDGDGLGNVCDEDSDADGIASGDDCNDEDASIGTASIYYEDVDGDGYGTGEPLELCPHELDASMNYATQSGDAFPEDPNEWSEPEEPEDADGDGIASWADCDDTDAEVGGPTTYYEDVDGDGYGAGEPIKACSDDLPSGKNYVLQSGDAFPTDPKEWKDTDKDGVGDNSDLCAGTKPIDSKDTVNPQGCALSQLDTDMDGLTDYEEVVIYKTDPIKIDTDRDGLTDRQEVETTHTDPLNKDTDGDGLTDGSEIRVFKTDPLDADTDNDGKSDGAEVKNPKYDPLNPLKRVKKARKAGVNVGSMRLALSTHWQGFVEGWIPKASAEAPPMTIQSFSYTYDPVGNIKAITDQSQTITKKTMNYEYDELNRLVNAKSLDYAVGDYEQSYDHDSIGNMIYKSDVGTMEYLGTGSPSPHAVTKVAGANYTYDKNGNLLSDGVNTYEWNIKNQLVKSGPYEFTYDALGQRVKSINTQTGEETIYVGPYMEIRSDRVIYYIFAGSMRVAALEVPRHEDGAFGDSSEGKLTYFHQDHLGGTTLATNEQGKVVQMYDYAPYGSQILDEGDDSALVAHSFTDKELEEGLGLYYFEARWYNPKTGQFVSSDPMQLWAPEKFLNDPMSLNYYSYAKNNPIIFIDPLGLEATIIIRKDNDGLFGTNDFGHTAIEIDGTVYHYYGAGTTNRKDYINGVEGVLATEDGMDDFINNYNKDNNGDGKDDTNEYFYTYTIETSDEENEKMAKYFNELKENTPEYKLFSNNCTTVIKDALEDAGVAEFDQPVKGQLYGKIITPGQFKSRLNYMNGMDLVDIISSDSFYESNY